MGSKYDEVETDNLPYKVVSGTEDRTAVAGVCQSAGRVIYVRADGVLSFRPQQHHLSPYLMMCPTVVCCLLKRVHVVLSVSDGVAKRRVWSM